VAVWHFKGEKNKKNKKKIIENGGGLTENGWKPNIYIKKFKNLKKTTENFD
jgi:hypothetical protein